MENLILPKQYKSELNLHDTQLAIKTVKDFFQACLLYTSDAADD